MKPICDICWRRLHPLGYGCPLSIHTQAGPNEQCSSNIHFLTDIELSNRRYFPERLEA